MSSGGGHPRIASALICALLTALACVPALATTIENTATVSYRHGTQSDPGPTITINSNTVRFDTGPAPSSTPAVITFWRQILLDPVGIQLMSAADVVAINIDGGFRQDASGTFTPVPVIVGIDGKLIETTVIASVQTTKYYPGEPVIVTLTDSDQNLDSSVHDYVEVNLDTPTGDHEVLRMQETGINTGVFATAVQGVSMPPAAVTLDGQVSLQPGSTVSTSYQDATFPQAVIEDVADVVPAPESSRLLSLDKQVSVPVAAIGDLLQYRLNVGNHNVGTTLHTQIIDTLPVGMRYRAGSLRIDSQAAPDPVIDNDGRTLTITIGSMAPAVKVEVTYLVEVVSNAAAGQAINRALASAAGGLVSNQAEAAVSIREPLFTSHFTIIGRVLEGECTLPMAERQGVANVRVLLDDGTYVTTDADGSYHFEGVRPGTHVVQLDTLTLPSQLEAAPCVQNTRFAGRAFSQFVEAQGGSLWRSDFFLQRKAAVAGEIGLRLQAATDTAGLRYTLQVDGNSAPVEHVRALLMLPEGTQFVAGSATLDGAALADPVVTENIATFALGQPAGGNQATPQTDWKHQLAWSLTTAAQCPSAGYHSKAVLLFDAGGKSGLRTAPADSVLACAAGNGDSGRQTHAVVTVASVDSTPAFADQQRQRLAILDDATAAGGGEINWLAGQSAGNDWLFPALDYNPRSPTTRIVIKHGPGQKVVLTRNGVPVSPIYYDGSSTSADHTASVSRWRAVPLGDGDNVFHAQLRDASDAVIASLDRTVHFATAAARATLVPEQSILAADGVHKPMIAVRIVDSSGHPVRAGVSGTYALDPPYLPAQTVLAQQQRQLAGLDQTSPTWHVEGDDGIAYIELMPTTAAGSAQLGFQFPDNNGGTPRTDELHVWLKSSPRDWVVVGFASGTLGYDTLKGNLQALADQDQHAGVRTDGQLSLYAKGRVQGKWMLTLAYDSDKPTDRLNRQNLLSTIDPNQFYTLYGDTTQQGYDASSADKLYLKLERDQFYALFGDYVTGLDRAQLSRYNRTLNGIKVEYRGPLVEFNGFAADTAQNFARDEIQGDGTSGLYRLTRRNIAINGERIRIETRDRFRSELIIESHTLTRHLDYDIDYSAGTLFFREPIHSRDFDFNPIYIVVEYETQGTGDSYLNAGGRVGINLLEGRLIGGVTYISDKNSQGSTRLAGIDANYKLREATELRMEVANSQGGLGSQQRSGSAYLVELEHHGKQLDALAYVRQQDDGFGLNQQNASESGMFKAGLDTRWRINDTFALQEQAYHQKDLDSGATRDAANIQLDYRADKWRAQAGVQLVRDQSQAGEVTESRQLTLGVNRSLLDDKLELSAAAEIGVGGKNESVDFPTRLQLGAAYAINEAVRLIAAQEFTDGKDRDTATTRLGFELVPWTGARLTSTLNQSQISEYGPRTFAQMGLNQKFQIGERWGVDLSLDSSQAFNESADAPPLTAPRPGPIASGGIRDGGALTEDFAALSAGATYRSELWSWNGRIEGRNGDTSDRYGFTTGFLRQIATGMAFAASAQAFSVEQSSGSRGLLGNISLSWVWRPLGSQWALLNRLELQVDESRHGTGGSAIGQDTLATTGDARSRRLINNLVINHVSDEWTEDDMHGDLFESAQRNQWSLYYGSKYVFDRFDDQDYSGYTDIIGLEWRFDVTSKIDIGLRGSVRHAWSQDNFSYAMGPVLGFSPFTNAWFSVGYNVIGFEDRDFDAAHYTRQGAYLMLRFKFDQATPGLSESLQAIGGGK